MSEDKKWVPFQNKHGAWPGGFTSVMENNKAVVSFMSQSVEDKIQGEVRGHGEEEFGRPSVLGKIQEQVPTTGSHPCGDQMTQLLQIGKAYESIDPLKSLGAHFSSLDVIGWVAPRNMADLFRLDVWFS